MTAEKRKLWTLREAAVWFAFRSEEAVALAYGGWETFGEFVSQCSVDADGVNLLEVDDASKARLRQKPFVKVLDALRSGALSAIGDYVGGKGERPIPADFWSGVKFPPGAATGQANGGAFFVRGILADDVKRKWPASDDPSAGGPKSQKEFATEKAVEEFIRLRGPKNGAGETKQDVLDAARKKYPGLSERAYNRAWDKGAHESRKAPGAPRLN